MNELKKWAKDIFFRAIKTFAESAASMITVGAFITDIDWKMIFSSAIVAFIYTVLINVATIPIPGGEGK